MNDLCSAGYIFNSEEMVWGKPSYLYFPYSDGDVVEQYLYESIRKSSDRSVFSKELAVLQKDWPSMYHLSFQRANLLRPLVNLFTGARVLEFGCGCGALSRFIGETAKELYAVEGSIERAKIAALRCEDLKNTNFIVDKIQDVSEKIGKFDIVTLIGVLEYASMFSEDENPEALLLRKVRSFLKEDGILILAIENKFGLKYFSGVLEDHTGFPWSGIMSAYPKKGAHTFSRHELQNLLVTTGFSYHEQFLVTPDYKFPASIITPLGLNVKQEVFDPVPILSHTKRPYELEGLFNLPQAWRGIYQANLLLDMADSLCFIAGRKKQEVFSKDVLCYHYGLLDNVSYAKEVRIIQEPEGVYVRRFPLVNEKIVKGGFFQCMEDEKYFSGKLLIEQMREVCVQNGWTLEDLKDVILPWFSWLKSHVDEHGNISANYIDAIPTNIFVNEDRSIIYFDNEWKSDNKIPFLYVVVRSFIVSFERMGTIRGILGKEGFVNTLFIIEAILPIIGINCSREDIYKAWMHGIIFEKTVCDDKIDYLEWLKNKIVMLMPEGSFTQWEILKKMKMELNFERAQRYREKVIAEKAKHDYVMLENSVSMRITAWVRFFKKKIFIRKVSVNQ